MSAAVAVLLPPGSPAAAPPTAAWTKTWAERELRLHFDATTVACLPLGAAARSNGANAFKDFVCGLVLADGSRLTIHLKPLTRTTWTTLSLKRLGPPPQNEKNGGGQGGPPAAAETHGQGKGKNA